jgi:hypothetical protein
MSVIQRAALRRNTAENTTVSPANLARRLRLETRILWPVFGLLSTAYIGLFGRVLGVW